MSEPRKNSYEDDDLRDVLAQIEGLKAKKKAVMAAALSECAKISKDIKDAKKVASEDLKIPRKVLNPLLKRRDLERQIEDLEDDVGDDFAEMYEDACGQFSFLAPREDVEDETVN